VHLSVVSKMIIRNVEPPFCRSVDVALLPGKKLRCKAWRLRGRGVRRISSASARFCQTCGNRTVEGVVTKALPARHVDESYRGRMASKRDCENGLLKGLAASYNWPGSALRQAQHGLRQSRRAAACVTLWRPRTAASRAR
jgi:hypothetical protein